MIIILQSTHGIIKDLMACRITSTIDLWVSRMMITAMVAFTSLQAMTVRTKIMKSVSFTICFMEIGYCSLEDVSILWCSPFAIAC